MHEVQRHLSIINRHYFCSVNNFCLYSRSRNWKHHSWPA